MNRVLITGGAGFIGRHLIRELLAHGNCVRVLDCLDPITHPASEPLALPEGVDFVRGDVRDKDAVAQALRGIDVVYHLAAKISVGASMIDAPHYIDHNVQGAATVLGQCRDRVRRFILASSRAVYGEGQAFCKNCGCVIYATRRRKYLNCAVWEPQCVLCGSLTGVEPVACGENTRASPTSVYGLTKKQQEELTSLMLQDSDTDWVVLRYFNVYGEGWVPRADDVGIVSVFARHLMNGRGVRFYEDGLQTRDFIHVGDVTRANVLAQTASSGTYNVGSGQRTTLRAVVDKLMEMLEVRPDIATMDSYRLGDVRHCLAATDFSRSELEWEAQLTLDVGLKRLIQSMSGS